MRILAGLASTLCLLTAFAACEVTSEADLAGDPGSGVADPGVGRDLAVDRIRPADAPIVGDDGADVHDPDGSVAEDTDGEFPDDSGPEDWGPCERPSFPQDCAQVDLFQCGFEANCYGSGISAIWHHHYLCGDEEEIEGFECEVTCPYGCAEGELGIWPHDGAELVAQGCLQCAGGGDCEGREHPECEGAWTCDHGSCAWVCDGTPRPLPADQSDCLGLVAAAVDPPPEGALVLVGGSGTVEIRHENLLTNCCREMGMSATVSGDAIAVAETTVEPYNPCFCECRFDLVAILDGLSPGTYTVTVTDPDEGDRQVSGNVTVQ